MRLTLPKQQLVLLDQAWDYPDDAGRSGWERRGPGRLGCVEDHEADGAEEPGVLVRVLLGQLVTKRLVLRRHDEVRAAGKPGGAGILKLEPSAAAIHDLAKHLAVHEVGGGLHQVGLDGRAGKAHGVFTPYPSRIFLMVRALMRAII